MFAHFWLRRGRMVLRPHLYCLPSRFTLVRSLYLVLGFCGLRRATVVLATIAAPIMAAILLLALRSAAVVAVFSPVSRFSL